MQGHRWEIMTALLRWHDNQVLLHLVMAAHYQLLHVGWQHYNHYYALTVMSRYAFVSCECFTITSRLRICFILEKRAICNKLTLTIDKRESDREKKEKEIKISQDDFLWSPCQTGFCLISEELSGLSHFILQLQLLHHGCVSPLHLQWHLIWFNLPITALGPVIFPIKGN